MEITNLLLSQYLSILQDSTNLTEPQNMSDIKYFNATPQISRSSSVIPNLCAARQSQVCRKIIECIVCRSSTEDVSICHVSVIRSGVRLKKTELLSVPRPKEGWEPLEWQKTQNPPEKLASSYGIRSSALS